jgi:outer membrane protein OmpA-like peptidoglycan-associated protein
MSYRLALLVAAGTTALGTAYAQDKEGYYATGGLNYTYEFGENDFQSEANSGTFDAQEFDSRLETSDGFGVYAGLGKYFSRGFRGEIEASWRNQDVEELPGDGALFAGFPTGANGQNVTVGAEGPQSRGDNRELGEFSVGALMLNGYKDFNFDIAGRFQPYLGAGIGIAKVRADFDNVDDQQAVTDNDPLDDLPIGYRIYASNDDFVPAVQGLAGINFGITENLSVNLGYRYMRTAEYDFEAYVNNEVADVTGEYEVHETTLGLRWDFGAGVAPTPVVEPQPQVRTKTCLDGTVVPMNQPCPTAAEEGLTPADLATVVYFEFDRADLSPAARTLLQRRAEEASDLDIVEIVVSGNTDTSGSDSYNERLSARRAQVVRDALVSYGIDGSKIQIRALGETTLAKPTQDGVKEPLNRRTEVEFDF